MNTIKLYWSMIRVDQKNDEEVTAEMDEAQIYAMIVCGNFQITAILLYSYYFFHRNRLCYAFFFVFWFGLVQSVCFIIWLFLVCILAIAAYLLV